MTTKTPTCEDCGATMVRDVRLRAWTYKGSSVTFDQPGWWCPVDASHDVLLDEADTDATERLLLENRAVVDGSHHPPR